jgi:branched-chain amino acid transport system permease protein
VGGAALAGVYVERLCFAPMGFGAGIASMVSSFAIWMQLEQAMILLLPRHTYPFPSLAAAEPWEVGPFFMRGDQLVMLACAVALSAGLYLLLYRSRFGLALRAIISNPTAAHLVGVDVKRAMLGAFALASAVGGLAGYLVLAVDQQVTPMFGMWATIKGLIAMMLGGLGSIPGAIVGGLLLGIIEMQSQWYLGPQFRDLIAYFLLFACLVLRPGGLMGEPLVREIAIQRRRA